jgi:hypothetical protein
MSHVDSTSPVTHVSLCAGYGGIDLGLHRAIPNLRTIAVSEIEAFACANLVAKMEAGLLDCAPIWTDLKTFPWAEFRDRVDILSGGYPCQPFSAPASASEPKTHDTSGRLSQPELLQCDQVPAFLKTSTDISRWGFPTFCKTWQDWVTERRGAWRARVNAARLTRGSGSSSWPTNQRQRIEELGRQIAVGSQQHSAWDDGGMDNSNAVAAGGIAGLMGDTQGEEQGEGLQRQRPGHAVGYAGQDPWPSRPGEQQHAWEPPRVVADAGRNGRRQDESAAGTAQGRLLLNGMVKQWATPRTPTGGPESAQRKQELGRTTSGGGDLASQAMTQWGSPRTGIRGDTHFSYDRGKHNIEEQAGASMKGGGKLNPRWVETLMGLPIGWTMPSCIRPVTIELTSCDSSGMALCQPSQSERSDFLLAS